MIPEKIEKAFNAQIKEEMFSAYLYLAMSAKFSEMNLDGFASWMYIQAQEEMEHAMKFYNHILERGGCIDLQKIEKPEGDWEKPLDFFKAAFKHEQYITSKIRDLMNLSIKEDDYESRSMLQWFVDEQVEEEDSTGTIVEKLEFIEGSRQGIFMMDRELGARKAE